MTFSTHERGIGAPVNSFLRSLFLFCLIGCFVGSAHAEKPVDPKPLDAIVDRALAAYNAQNATAFFADFAKSMAAIANSIPARRSSASPPTTIPAAQYSEGRRRRVCARLSPLR